MGSTLPPIQCVPGALSPGVKRPEREADDSTPASDEVKKMWIYATTAPYAFTAQCLPFSVTRTLPPLKIVSNLAVC
jgi:hypothetical protein